MFALVATTHMHVGGPLEVFSMSSSSRYSVILSVTELQYSKAGLMGTIICNNRNLHKIRMDENNYEIWRGMGLPIPDDISQKVDVSTC